MKKRSSVVVRSRMDSFAPNCDAATSTLPPHASIFIRRFEVTICNHFIVSVEGFVLRHRAISCYWAD